jgi:hypothetical protein
MSDDLRKIICSEHAKFMKDLGENHPEPTYLWVQKIIGLGISCSVLYLERGLCAVDDFAKFVNKHPNCVYSIGHNEEQVFQESHNEFDPVEDTLIYAVPKELAEKILVLQGIP